MIRDIQVTQIKILYVCRLDAVLLLVTDCTVFNKYVFMIS